jgi:hypothetical protein
VCIHNAREIKFARSRLLSIIIILCGRVEREKEAPTEVLLTKNQQQGTTDLRELFFINSRLAPALICHANFRHRKNPLGAKQYSFCRERINNFSSLAAGIPFENQWSDLYFHIRWDEKQININYYESSIDIARSE